MADKPLFTADMVKTALASPQTQPGPPVPDQGEPDGLMGSNGSELPFFANPDASPQRIQPGQPLAGGVTQNVNPAELALRSSILGFLETPETLANAVGSVAQQGVPQEQRVTAADLLHHLGIKQTPGEYLESPAYQQQVQGAGPLGGAAAIGGQLAGGFAFPMGFIGALGKGAAKGAQMIPKIGKVAAPLIEGAAKLLPKGAVAQKAVQGAATGAGYGLTFGQGKKFGQTKQNMNPQEAGTNALLGGGIGAGVGSGIEKISQMLAGRAGAAAQLEGAGSGFMPASAGGNYSPKTTGNLLDAFITKNPEQGQRAVQVANKRTAGRGGEYREAISDVQKKSAQRETKASQQEQKVSKNNQAKRANNLMGQIRKEKDLRERRDYAKMTKEEQRAYNEKRDLEKRRYSEKQGELKASDRRNERTDARQHQEQVRNSQQATREKATQESRQFTENRDQAKRSDRQNETQQKEGKTGSRTERSNHYYANLYENIRSADDADMLREYEKAIYASPQAKDGSRLLDNDQRQNLMRQFRLRLSDLKKENKVEPGESKGHQPAEPVAPQAKAATPEPKPAKQQAPTEPTKPQPKPATTGDFRKMIKGREKERERRHEGALSADRIAASGKLTEAEHRTFKESVDQLAEAHVEMAYARKEIEKLSEWGLANPEKWGNPSASYDSIKTADGMMVAKAGAVDGYLLRAKIEKVLTKAQQQAVSDMRNKLVTKGIERGDITPRTYKDALEVTVGGKADYAEVNEAGKLKVVGMQKLAAPSRDMPKNVQEMYDRIERLRGRLASHHELSEEIKSDIMPIAHKIFEENKAAWAATEHDPERTPAFDVFHKDEYGHVSTIKFKQGSIRHEFNEATKDLKAQLDALHQKFIAESDREKTVTDIVKKNTLHGFTGLEPILMAPIIGKAVGKRAAQFTKATESSALFVGTIRDIFKSHPQYMGDVIANKFDEINGRILEGFAQNGHRMVRITGGEDLTALLNKFKGVPVDQIMYAKIKDVTQAERETAVFFRKNYKELADTIKPVLDEMKARGRDVKFGIQEGRKYSGDQLQEGRLRKDAHSKLYEEGLQQMHDAALLKGKNWEMASSAFATLLNRKNSAIFANNPRVGLANFIDPLPMNLVEFGRHWLSASVSMNRPGVKEALKRLPIVPQADLTSIEMNQRKLIAKPVNTNIFEKLVDVHENVNEFLGNKLDFLFKGKEKLTGLADKMYTRNAVLASIHRQAKMRGMDGNDLIDSILLNKKPLEAGLRRDVWKSVAQDVSQLFNTLNPTMNRDLFADSMLGKMTAAYSRPQRRVGRYMYNLMKGDAKDKTKFFTASMMYLTMGGRAVLPTSVRNMITYSGAMGLGFGGARAAVDSMQNLDKMNALDNLTGWDLSDRISYDAINIASPTMDDLSSLMNDISSVRNGESPEARTGRIAARVVTGLALFPKIAGMGVGYLNSVGNNFRYAQEGSRPLYVNVGPVSKKVPIPYDYKDAMRDSILAGPNPKAKAVKPEVEKALAGRIDARRDAMFSKLTPSAAAE